MVNEKYKPSISGLPYKVSLLNLITTLITSRETIIIRDNYSLKIRSCFVSKQTSEENAERQDLEKSR